MDLPGRIGGYVVERELGAGGMGTVYLARSRGGRAVAVKVARPELAADPHFRARFRVEVEAARRVGGFHTAPVVDADPDAAAPWLATAYIAGPTLSGLLAEHGPMDEPELRLFGAALAEALQAIQACGLIHRDLKPGNIIMADDGPRVLDFGIARAVESTRLTATGTAFGTPGFLAPEQAQGLEVGSAADVFALGAVLVAAAGGSAFGEGTPMGLMYRSVHEPPDLSALPQGIRPVVADCLAKDPAHRPTPERLLDLFAPDTAPYTPTLPVPAKPTPEPTAAVGTAAAPAAGGLESAATVAAARHPDPRPSFAQQAPRGQVPTTARLAKRRTGLFAAGVVGALLVVGGAGFAAYTLNGSDDAPFPEATHELITPHRLAGGVYELESEELPSKVKDEEDSKDVTYIQASYAGTEKAHTFQEVRVSGEYGRFKNPERDRDALMKSVTRTGEETVQSRKKIRTPGSSVEFSCETVSSPAYDTITVCAWGDDNTVGSVEFDLSDPSKIEQAAAETRKIRDDMRKPIA
ncbi:serine/threonine-protein kinase [Streptomyces sp. NBS 14/10]|uniref:serine/threonine protein kinase n=1 Tax=Streptomyces sp. NBS 14/10 TaxID=1945643 RepID=UPI00211ACB74|nr:serine/threonine-protein kinase [Streptomyces sp. NBS 14/10]KAK1179011.1 serine/threonine-protein kinase [Streptomyces sp. NBS 14/10]